MPGLGLGLESTVIEIINVPFMAELKVRLGQVRVTKYEINVGPFFKKYP